MKLVAWLLAAVELVGIELMVVALDIFGKELELWLLAVELELVALRMTLQRQLRKYYGMFP